MKIGTTMRTQLKYLQNDIDKITLDNIKNNNEPKIILAMFKTIGKNIYDIRMGRRPYTEET